MELIKIQDQDGEQVVSARELHEFLGIETRFNMWIARMFEYGFEEGTDFCTNLGESTGGRPGTDYALTMDAAKQIAMVQRSEKGRQARLYFLECEKRLKAMAPEMDILDIAMMNLQRLKEQDKRMKAIESEQASLAQAVNRVEAKVTAVNEEFYTLAGYYVYRDKRFNLTTGQAQRAGKALVAKSAEMEYIVGKAHNERYGAVNTYHLAVLEAVLNF